MEKFAPSAPPINPHHGRRSGKIFSRQQRYQARFFSLQIDSVQGEAFDTMIQNNGTVVFQSGERINIPATLEIIWEVNFSL
jgi:hypothetical protein